MDIIQLEAFEDNYIYLLKEGDTVAVVDPGDADVVLDYLTMHKLPLNYILNTHHHYDHVGGNQCLKEETGCIIFGGERDHDRIPALDHTLKEGDTVSLGATQFQVLDIPGHTHGHIGYFAPSLSAFFCGDTLFSIGCGRVFEGHPKTLWKSLQKIKALPTDTRIYCAHEYTLSNLRFALSLDPENKDLQKKLESVQSARSQNTPTVPSLLEEELHLNPFLNCPDVETFIERRSQKDIVA